MSLSRQTMQQIKLATTYRRTDLSHYRSFPFVSLQPVRRELRVTKVVPRTPCASSAYL